MSQEIDNFIARNTAFRFIAYALLYGVCSLVAALFVIENGQVNGFIAGCIGIGMLWLTWVVAVKTKYPYLFAGVCILHAIAEYISTFYHSSSFLHTAAMIIFASGNGALAWYTCRCDAIKYTLNGGNKPYHFH